MKISKKVSRVVAMLSLTLLFTLSPKPTYAWKFMGYEADYVGYACDGFGNCYQSYVVKYYVFGICVKTDYVIESCYE